MRTASGVEASNEKVASLKGTLYSPQPLSSKSEGQDGCRVPSGQTEVALSKTLVESAPSMSSIPGYPAEDTHDLLFGTGLMSELGPWTSYFVALASLFTPQLRLRPSDTKLRATRVLVDAPTVSKALSGDVAIMHAPTSGCRDEQQESSDRPSSPSL